MHSMSMWYTRIYECIQLWSNRCNCSNFESSPLPSLLLNGQSPIFLKYHWNTPGGMYTNPPVKSWTKNHQLPLQTSEPEWWLCSHHSNGYKRSATKLMTLWVISIDRFIGEAKHNAMMYCCLGSTVPRDFLNISHSEMATSTRNLAKRAQ